MEDAIALLVEAQKAGLGWYGVAAAGVVILVRLLRSEVVQRLLPMVAQWRNLRPWAQMLIVAASSLAASWVAALLAGQTPLAALGAAVPVAMTAIGGHKTTKAIGHTQTRRRLAKNPLYRPGAVRTAISPILPVDTSAVSFAVRTQEIKTMQSDETEPDATIHSPGNGSL